MAITRKLAFRVIMLLTLTALLMMPMVPVGASPDWEGKHRFSCEEGSYRDVSMCTNGTDVAITSTTIPYPRKQSYDLVFTPWVAGLVNITIPKDSYHSEPFYLKPLGPYSAWAQVYLVADGNGTLDTVGGVLQDVDISITTTGNGTGGFDVGIARSGGAAPAGSAIIYFPLYMDVWLGTSMGNSTVQQFLFAMPFPMLTTTGFIEVTIDDTAGPYPPGSISMDGLYMNATGVPFGSHTATLVGAGAGLDIYAAVPLVGNLYTDFIFTDSEVLAPAPVGGIWISVDKLALLAPYIALASTIILAVAATAIFFKYRKKP